MQAQPDLSVALILWLNTIGHEKLGSKSTPKIKIKGGTCWSPRLVASGPVQNLARFPQPKRSWEANSNESSSRKANARLREKGFLLRILWYSQSGNHPKNYLARFGYALDMKVFIYKKKSRFFLYSWLPTWELII